MFSICLDSSLALLISSFFASHAFGTSSNSVFCSFSVSCFSSASSSVFSCFVVGRSFLSISSCGVNAYFQTILSLNLKGIAKSFMFLRATRVAGSSYSSYIIFSAFNFSWTSFSTDFRFSVFSSSLTSCPGRR